MQEPWSVFVSEASPDMHHLADYLGDCIARRRWRLMGAASQSEARSFTVARVRRVLGVGAARAMARHLIRRLPFLGLSRAAMDQHLQQHRARAWARREVGTGVDGLRIEDFFAFQAHVGGDAA